jgi:hypothetical protein
MNCCYFSVLLLLTDYFESKKDLLYSKQIEINYFGIRDLIVRLILQQVY